MIYTLIICSLKHKRLIFLVLTKHFLQTLPLKRMDSLIRRIQLVIFVRTLLKLWSRINRLSKKSILMIQLLNSCSRLLIATRSPHCCWYLCRRLKTLFPLRILSTLFFSSFQICIFFSWWTKISVAGWLFAYFNLIKKAI